MPTAVGPEVVNGLGGMATTVIGNLTLLVRRMSKTIPHDARGDLPRIEGVPVPAPAT